MCTLNLTFDVPDTKAIDIEALKIEGKQAQNCPAPTFFC